MPKKSSDPFMANLWTALVADKLGPAGHDTDWVETPVRIRNRFIRAVRQVLGSGAAFAASLSEVDAVPKSAAPKASSPPAAKKAAAKKATAKSGKRHDPRELHLPLMSSVQSRDKFGTAETASKKRRR